MRSKVQKKTLKIFEEVRGVRVREGSQDAPGREIRVKARPSYRRGKIARHIELGGECGDRKATDD